MSLRSTCPNSRSRDASWSPSTRSTIHAYSVAAHLPRQAVVSLTTDVVATRTTEVASRHQFLIRPVRPGGSGGGSGDPVLSGAPRIADTSRRWPPHRRASRHHEPLWIHLLACVQASATCSPWHLAVPDPASLATVGLAMRALHVPTCLPRRPSRSSSVAGGLAKLAAKGVGDDPGSRRERASDENAMPASSDRRRKGTLMKRPG